MWEQPTDFALSPPFACSDVPFAQYADKCAQFSALLMPHAWLRRSTPVARRALWDSFRAQGRTAVIFTNVDRGGVIGQLAWFVVFKTRRVRARLFKGDTYNA